MPLKNQVDLCAKHIVSIQKEKDQPFFYTNGSGDQLRLFSNFSRCSFLCQKQRHPLKRREKIQCIEFWWWISTEKRKQQQPQSPTSFAHSV